MTEALSSRTSCSGRWWWRWPRGGRAGAPDRRAPRAARAGRVRSRGARARGRRARAGPARRPLSRAARCASAGADARGARCCSSSLRRCPVCKTLLPTLLRVAAESARGRVVLASDGEPRASTAAFVRRAGARPAAYLLSAELGLRFQVAKLPYAVLIDAAGVVRAKGLVNTREHLESLFEATERGVASIQEYLARERCRTRCEAARDRVVSSLRSPRRASARGLARRRPGGAASSPGSARCWWAPRRRRCCRSRARPRRRRARRRPEDLAGPEGDPTSCDYWRHCAIDGFLCSCCGGSATHCPPGTEVVARHLDRHLPQPGRRQGLPDLLQRLLRARVCGRCPCNRNEGERPEYHWYRNNDINWCAGASIQVYHCSIAIVLGRASEPQPER